MNTFSCPYCFKLVEYTLPFGWSIIWTAQVKRWEGSWIIATDERDIRDLRAQFEKKLNIPLVEYLIIYCPHCHNKLIIFMGMSSNREGFQSDSNDFSMEI